MLRKLSALGLILTLAGCTNLIFQPTQRQYSEPEQLGINAEDIAVSSSGGVMLHGWRLPVTGEIRGSVLFLHGNGENVSSHIGSVYWLPDHGYEVFLLDYRGYGRSSGVAELDGVVSDVSRMIEFSVRHAASPSHNLTVLGHSLGGSLAIYALANMTDRTGINALVTVSAFSDYRRIARDALSRHWTTWLLQWPLSLTISNRYCPADVISKVSPTPVFLLHSEADEIIPAYHADRLFEAAHQPKRFVPIRGGHNLALVSKTNRKLLVEILNSVNPLRGSALTGTARR